MSDDIIARMHRGAFQDLLDNIIGALLNVANAAGDVESQRPPRTHAETVIEDALGAILQEAYSLVDTLEYREIRVFRRTDGDIKITAEFNMGDVPEVVRKEVHEMLLLFSEQLNSAMNAVEELDGALVWEHAVYDRVFHHTLPA